MKLSVPHIHQPNSFSCGIVAAQMVLNFHGRNISFNRLAREMHLKKEGTDNLDIGIFFLKEGFEITIHCWDWAFPPRLIQLPEYQATAEILKWSNRRTKHEYRSQKRIFRRLLPKFLEEGGHFIPWPVTLNAIKTAIRHGEPPILSVNSCLLYGTNDKKTGSHYVVPYGYSKNDLFINDPSSKPYGGRKVVASDFLMYASYRDNAGAIFVKK